MNTKQKRWTSEQQILDAIDAESQRATALTQEAQELDNKADCAMDNAKRLYFELSRTALSVNERVEKQNQMDNFALLAKNCRRQAKKKMKSATRILDVKLKKLGAVLAAFRTEAMSFLGNDVAVVG